MGVKFAARSLFGRIVGKPRSGGLIRPATEGSVVVNVVQWVGASGSNPHERSRRLGLMARDSLNFATVDTVVQRVWKALSSDGERFLSAKERV